MNADKKNKPAAAKDASKGDGYFKRLELAVDQLKERLQRADKKRKPEAEKDTSQGPQLDKKEAAKWAGHWKRLELTVHHLKDYFPLDIQPLMENVANFYAKYGVLLSWQEAQDDSSIVPHLARVKERTDAGLPLKDNPDLEYFWEHFPHKPSIFFVGDIRVKGHGGLRSLFGPDVEGFTFLNTFVFVAYSNAPWIPQYEVTVARELGHVFGLTDDPTGASLMSRGYHSSLNEDSSFLPTEVVVLRNSPWLRRVLKVKPTLDSKRNSKPT
ncbi:MAG TPA: hypothetical protein VH682_02345 [Gemmataceae bacterium]|jgi:hypothetical protein